MKEFLKKTIFYKWYRKLADLKRELAIRKYRGAPADLYCTGCNQYWKSFKPLPQEWFTALKEAGWKYGMNDAETLNYQNYSCYGCGITDRDRLYLLYFKKILDSAKNYDIVEFAPTPVLGKFFQAHGNIAHRTSDLFMEGVDDQLDLQDLSAYRDGQFDIFICSHILEHVDDDIKAMKELYRILKSGGHGIAMVPIIESVEKTHEDISIKDPQLRMKYFGQGDHVRLYAKKDFIQRLESVGFRVALLGNDYFGPGVFEKNAITSKSLLYVVEKP